MTSSKSNAFKASTRATRTGFIHRILTARESAYVLRHADPSQRLAGRWAAKEAALKALGTGLAEGIGWRDVEILPDEFGKPILQFFQPRAHSRGGARRHCVFM